jgi:octaprenyl-diphosphate synthase
MCYFCSVKNLSDIISPIAAELQQFEAFFEASLKSDTEPMDSIMHYVLDTKGKRLRPILVLLSAKLFGEVNEQTLRAATFVEMLHNATLLHDDVVDDTNQRRNKASVKAQFGNLSAVLAGDYLLAKAMLLLAHPNDYAILQEMLSATAAMSEGELMQNLSICVPADGDNEYIDIITRKTALLMRSCCAAGALSVNATAEKVQQISDFGLNFGILFQLRDDILDGEHTERASALLPEYQQKTLDLLKLFPKSETLESLRDLTVFCAEREV